MQNEGEFPIYVIDLSIFQDLLLIIIARTCLLKVVGSIQIYVLRPMENRPPMANSAEVAVHLEFT
jgi:hypothetical protein